MDFENLPKVDLAALPNDVTVAFFSVSKEFLKTAFFCKVPGWILRDLRSEM